MTSATLTKCLRRWLWRVSRSSKRTNSNVLTQRCLLNPIELMLDLSVGICTLFQAPTKDLALPVLLYGTTRCISTSERTVEGVRVGMLSRSGIGAISFQRLPRMQIESLNRLFRVIKPYPHGFISSRSASQRKHDSNLKLARWNPFDHEDGRVRAS